MTGEMSSVIDAPHAMVQGLLVVASKVLPNAVNWLVKLDSSFVRTHRLKVFLVSELSKWYHTYIINYHSLPASSGCCLESY